MSIEMNQILGYFLADLKDFIQKKQIKKVVQKTQKFLQKTNFFDASSCPLLIKIMELEAYACSKLFYVFILDSKNTSSHYLFCLLTIMHRNLKTTHQMLSDYISNNFIFLTQRISYNRPFFSDKQRTKLINNFFYQYFNFSKMLALYFEYRDQKLLKIGALVYAIESINHFHINSIHSLKVLILSLQIRSLYSMTMKQSRKYVQGSVVINDFEIYLKVLSMIYEKKKEKTQQYFKKTLKIFYLTLFSILELRILTNKMGATFILYSVIKRMLHSCETKKILRPFKFLNQEIDEVMESYLETHSEMSSIITIAIPEIKNLKKEKEDLLKLKWFQDNSKKEYDENNQLLKKQIYSLVFASLKKSYQDKLDRELKHISKRMRSEKKKNPKSQKLVRFEDQEQQSKSKTNISLYNSKTQKKSTFSRKSKYFSFDKRRSTDKNIETQEKEIFFQKMKQFYVSNLKQKNKMKVLSNQLMSQSLENEYEDEAEKIKLIQDYTRYFEQKKHRETARKYEIRKFTSIRDKFINLIIKNKEVLSINRYANFIVSKAEKKKKAKDKKQALQRMNQTEKAIKRHSSCLGIQKKIKFRRLDTNENKENQKTLYNLLEQTRELCYKRSKQSVKELQNKIEKKQIKKKLVKKSQTCYDLNALL